MIPHAIRGLCQSKQQLTRSNNLHNNQLNRKKNNLHNQLNTKQQLAQQSTEHKINNLHNNQLNTKQQLAQWWTKHDWSTKQLVWYW